jgi:hypothetical protein
MIPIDDNYDFPATPDSMIVFGGIVLLVSCGVTSFANILMKLDAIQLEAAAEGTPKFILTRRLVLGAISLYLIGGIADFTVLSFVPLMLRACTSCLTIPVNALFARFLLRESMTPVQIFGACVTVVCCLLAMMTASRQTAESTTNLLASEDLIDLIFSRRMVIFTLSTVPMYGLCLSVIKSNLPLPGASVNYPTAGYRLIVLLSSAYAASYQTGWTNLFIKILAMNINFELISFFNLILILIIGISALAQMYLMSAMMRLFDAVVVIPPYQILITIWLIVMSAVVFHETPRDLLGFTLSLICSFGGIFIVAMPPASSASILDRGVEQPLVESI